MIPSLIIFTLFPILSLCQYIQQFNNCSTKLYSCGHTVQWIGYPFWGNDRPSYCGLPGFHLTCRDGDVTTLQISDTTFRVLRIDENQTRFILALDGIRNESDACSLRPVESVNSSTFEHTVFSYSADRILFLGLHLSCLEDDVTREIPIRNRLSCSRDEDGRVSFFDERSLSFGERCEREIRVPVLKTAFDEFNRSETMPLEEVLMQGFAMEYRVDGGGICSRCESSGGTCWSNLNSSAPSCLCSGGISRMVCLSNSGSKFSLSRKLFVGVGSVLISAVLTFIIYYIIKSSPRNYVALFMYKTEDDKSVEAFIMQYGSLTTQRYSYSDIKKMTNSFQVTLGQGGFGTVYKGKLSDGRLVAVKLLNSLKANGQEFINEVASIGRTSHVNIVTLMGFCFDHKKRALVYEFMENGSLDKFIYSQVPCKTSERIGVDKLYEIALGIARGLDYLHRGCNTRILHLDIKPPNILLDEDFCPKIADFGLAKLYSRKESFVSMLEARGTIGYISPEVFNRNFGGVSHKSDVYSYGMLILDMVGGRKNVDSGHSSDMYFPNWIYNHVTKDEFLFDGATTLEENDYAKKMTIVGLWCIQAYPNQRPSIDKVIEMLEGGIEELELPPKPFFSSPQRSPNTLLSTEDSALESLSIEH